ncbi:ABC transporter substrate-binding protein [Pseudonocardia sp. GCM10023141]|uniref:ABC transporter substrate-binding protein n=1 Tax=Pseudonocardia sp. GCM10023141 TaxID=3252653 RepID=UPI00361FE8FC
MSRLRSARPRFGARGALLLAVFLSLVLTACSSSPAAAPAASTGIDPNLGGDAAWQQIVNKANAEGTVVLYSSNDQDAATLPAAFNASYPGIKLEVDHFASGALTAKLDAEAGGGTGADVATHSSRAWWQANRGRLAPIAGPAIPKYLNGSPDIYGDKQYALIAANPLGVAVNTNRLKELGAQPIASYKDLLQPALKDNLGVVPGEGSPAAEQWWYYAAEQMGGQPGLTQLAALNPRLYRSGTTPLATDVASGEIAVGFYATRASVDALKAKGAPVEFLPIEPAIGIGGYIGIVGKTHPNAAQVLANWMLSPAGQAVLSKGGILTPLSPDVLGSAGSGAKQITPEVHVTDGILTPEQDSFYRTQMLPTLVTGR